MRKKSVYGRTDKMSICRFLRRGELVLGEEKRSNGNCQIRRRASRACFSGDSCSKKGLKSADEIPMMTRKEIRGSRYTNRQEQLILKARQGGNHRRPSGRVPHSRVLRPANKRTHRGRREESQPHCRGARRGAPGVSTT